MRQGLAVRAGAGGLARGLRPDRQHGVDVAGRDRVMHQARALGALLEAQRRDHGPVEQPHAGHREAALDRAPRQLVAEPEAIGAIFDHPRELRGGQGAQLVAEQQGGQLGRDVRWHHRQALERLAAVGVQPAQPGEHRILDAGRHLVARRGERLGDEERVAARERVHGGRIATAARGQRLHRAARQRRELDAMHRAADDCPEQPVQRMARIELVAHRQDQHGAHGVDAACRVAEHVEGGVVGPVEVLDDEDGGPLLGELLQQRREDAIHRAVVCQRGPQRTVAARRRVVQRTERARGDEVVARRHEDPRRAPHAPGQRADQARLADARLAGDQRGRAVPLRGLGHGADEDLELRVSLEQDLGHPTW